MNKTFHGFVKNEMLSDELLSSMQFICIPIYSPSHGWWFGASGQLHSHLSNPIVMPFDGIMRRLGGTGTWFRELEFDGMDSVVPTTCCRGVEEEYRRTPAGSWLWIESEYKAVCYCNDACDAHVLCLDRDSMIRLGLEASVVTSLRATVTEVSRLPNQLERRWHAIFFLHHIRHSVQLPGMSLPGFLGSLAV
jgi:hypothetical protein